MLETLRGTDQPFIELEEWRHRVTTEPTREPRLLVVVNAHASGVENPERTASETVALLQELGTSADGAVTTSEEGLWEALRSAAATGRRVVLVGGDGSLHAAANAPLSRLPELALIPAGRANNIARALSIPVAPAAAAAVAARAPARPLDALAVQTPSQRLYAIEAVSAGFHAAARSGYSGENSADLRSGVRALVRAVLAFAPYRMRARVDGGPLASDRAAQLFLSNLPYFGFGFEVDPGADAGDGRFEAILLEARSRPRLLRLLAATYRGRHLRLRGVRRVATREARIDSPLPLVADTVALGTTTATVTVEPARLRVAAPHLELAQ